ncbi:MAG: fibronectin type III domain-containing protein, partial [bacterium]
MSEIVGVQYIVPLFAQYVQFAANAFTTGAQPGGYVLREVHLAFAGVRGDAGDVFVAVHETRQNSEGELELGTMIATLSGDNPMIGRPSALVFTNAGTHLDPDTTYAVQVSAPDAKPMGGNQFAGYRIQTTRSPVQHGSVGWFIADTHLQTRVDDDDPEATEVLTIDRPLKFAIIAEPELAPSFADDASIPDQVIVRRVPIDRALPAATGGNGALRYTTDPPLPAGLTIDASGATPRIVGTTTEQPENLSYTYRVHDSDHNVDDSDRDTLEFQIEILPQPTHVTLELDQDRINEGAGLTKIIATYRLFPAESAFIPEMNFTPGQQRGANLEIDDVGLRGLTPSRPDRRTIRREIRLDFADDKIAEGDEFYEVFGEGNAGDVLLNVMQTVTIVDDETLDATLSKTEITVAENGEDTYTVALTVAPENAITMTLTPVAADDHPFGPIRLNNAGADDMNVPVELTFDRDNWSTPQTVIVHGHPDNNVLNDRSATIQHTMRNDDFPDGIVGGEVSVTIPNDDALPEAVINLTASALSPITLKASWEEPPNTVPPVLSYLVSHQREGADEAIFFDNPIEAITTRITDLEPDTQYTVTVRAINAVDIGPEKSVTARTSVPNMAPVPPPGLTSLNVDENSAPGTEVGIVRGATDPESDDLTYFENPGDSDGDALFDVSADGAVSVADGAMLDREAASVYYYEVAVRDSKINTVSDDNGEPDEAVDAVISVLITVNDVNEAPTFDEGPRATRTVLENIAVGEDIGAAKATDPEGDALTYTEEGGDGGALFDVDADGAVRVAPDAAFDFEDGARSYTLRVGVRDSRVNAVGATNGEGDEALDDLIELTLNIADADDPPHDLEIIGYRTVAEDAELTLALVGADIDTDAADLIYRETSDVGTISQDSDGFAWTPDFDDAGTHTLEFAVADESGGEFMASVDIEVTNTNRAPRITRITATPSSPLQSGQTTALTARFADADRDDTHTFAWSADDGAFSAANAQDTDWTAPAVDEDTTITLTLTVTDETVTDDDGLSATQDIALAVRAAPSGIVLSLAPMVASEGAPPLEVEVRATVLPDGSAFVADTPITLSVGDDGKPGEGIATEGVDYEEIDKVELNFAALATDGVATFTLTPMDDDEELEGEERIDVAVAAPDDIAANSAPAVFLLYDNDQPGVVISPRALRVGEDDASTTYIAVLTTKPKDEVVLAATSSDADIAVVTSEVRFTPDDWDVEQTFLVTGVDDDIDNIGDQRVATISHRVIESSYNAESIDEVSVQVIDDDDAGIVISLGADVHPLVNDIVVREGSSTDYFVRLAAEPRAAPVTVTVTTRTDRDCDDFTIEPREFVFDKGNWNTLQTATIKTTDDKVECRDLPIRIVHNAAGGDDYDGARATVRLRIIEDDIRGIDTDIANLSVAEGGEATYTVSLQSTPTGDTTMTITAADIRLSFAPETLTFTAENFDAPQTVTVSADDDEIDNAGAATVIHAFSGADYNNVFETPRIQITDDDTAGVTIATDPASDPPTITLDEDDGTATYTVMLNTQPSSDVIVTATSGDTSIARTNGAESTAARTLTFTAVDWNVQQTVTVTAVNDDLDSERGTTIAHTVASTADADYDDIAAASVAVTLTDDDAAPGAPTGLSASASSSSALSLSWSASADTNPAVTGYAVEYRVSGSGDGEYTDAAHSDTSTTATITGLDPNTEYEVRVAAINAVGTGAYANATARTSLNTAPTFTDGDATTRAVAENTASGANVGAPLAATDPDNEALTFSKQSGGTGDALFEVSESGQITVADDADLDFETTNSYTLTVGVRDNRINTPGATNGDADTAVDDTIAVTISITDVDEAPTLAIAGDTTVAENDELTLTLNGADA